MGYAAGDVQGDAGLALLVVGHGGAHRAGHWRLGIDGDAYCGKNGVAGNWWRCSAGRCLNRPLVGVADELVEPLAVAVPWLVPAGHGHAKVPPVIR